MSTAQNWAITVAVAGRPLGVFDTKNGGETTAEVTKYRPGGMAPQKINPALPEHGDVTVGREFEPALTNNMRAYLRPLVGRANMTASAQPLDAFGVPFGPPIVYTGTLTGMTDPDADSESADTSMFEITMSVKDVQ